MNDLQYALVKSGVISRSKVNKYLNDKKKEEYLKRQKNKKESKDISNKAKDES